MIVRRALRQAQGAPRAVLYSRFVFSCNLLAPLVLLACLGLAKNTRSGGRRRLAARRDWCLFDLWMIAAAFVNQRSGPEDVIIASPAVAWLAAGRAADFQMALAAAGETTAHLPAGLPASRFSFDPRPEHARYVIVDNLWLNWGAVHMPGAAALAGEVSGWPLAFQSGEVRVYRNPNP